MLRVRMLEIRSSDRHGRGVFATAAAWPGQRLEVCPALVLDPADTATVDRTAVGGHVVAWDRARTAVAFGLLAMCNHAHPPTALLETHDSPHGPAVALVAAVPIGPGDEVTIDYGPDHRV